MVLSINVGLTSKFHVEREVTTTKQTTKKNKASSICTVSAQFRAEPFLADTVERVVVIIWDAGSTIFTGEGRTG